MSDAVSVIALIFSVFALAFTVIVHLRLKDYEVNRAAHRKEYTDDPSA